MWSYWKPFSCKQRSVWCPCFASKGVRVNATGHTEQRLHTRYDMIEARQYPHCVSCASPPSPLLATLTLSQLDAQQPVRHAVTHTRRCWCNSDAEYTRGTCAASLGWDTCGGGLRLLEERSVGVAHSPADARDAKGLVGSRVCPDNTARGTPAGARVGETRSKPYRAVRVV
jgi:hypothetical protein